MSLWSILLLAFGLSMDAAAVSAAKGLATPKILPRHVLSVSLYFGGFQALMPLLGGLLGAQLGDVFLRWDHWIAFGLLGFIGGKMLWEAFHPKGEDDANVDDPFATRAMLVLALATSIDALAVGVTLPMLNAPIFLSVAMIGVTTALLSALALYAGKKFGELLGRRMDIVGGLVLIGIGTKILLDHLLSTH